LILGGAVVMGAFAIGANVYKKAVSMAPAGLRALGTPGPFVQQQSPGIQLDVY